MTSRHRYLDHFPEPLLEELLAGRWLPVVGAGLSRNADVPGGAHMPLWEDLGRMLANDIPGHDYAGALDAISGYEHEFGRRALITRLHRELLVDEARPGDAHTAFCRLPFDRAITTNFDFLLERGYQALGAQCDVVLDEEQLAIPTRRQAVQLLKFHGDLRHPGRLVATEDDYDRFLMDYPVLATHVASLLIDRVPILIGYSLDDPDLRQLLATLRSRLGPMLPTAYALGVDVAPAVVARYERRGVRVVNLPGSGVDYGATLTAAFTELDVYWRGRVLSHAEFTEERPLEEVETAVQGASSRLCYFAVPASRLAIYREQVFPLAEAAGLVPVSGFDVEVGAGNLFAAVGALLERSRAAVVDASTGVGSTELNAALHIVGPADVMVVTQGGPPVWVDVSGVQWISSSEPDIYSNPAVLGKLEEWFAERGELGAARRSDVQTLLAAKQWRAALVAAVSDLEAALRSRSPDFDGRAERPRRRPTLRELIVEAPLDAELQSRLLDSIALRNVALHEGASVSRADAQQAAGDVERGIALLGSTGQ
jgi:hypothetical protein